MMIYIGSVLQVNVNFMSINFKFLVDLNKDIFELILYEIFSFIVSRERNLIVTVY